MWKGFSKSFPIEINVSTSNPAFGEESFMPFLFDDADRPSLYFSIL